MYTITLPDNNSRLIPYTLTENLIEEPKTTKFNRNVFAAAHVVANPMSQEDPLTTCSIDWDKTLAYRRYLSKLGLGIAEAMDTAQRGMGLDWDNALELIRLTVNEINDVPVFCGIGTDHLDLRKNIKIVDIIDAYLFQLDAIQSIGGRAVIMASRAMTRINCKAKDYIEIYKKILSHCDQPVIIHWLGEMFDPQLKGYWGEDNYEKAKEICLQVIFENQAKIDGIKISLLNKDYEIDFRNVLPDKVRMYTGDDFNYPELISGDIDGYSDALLGIFDPIALAASSALEALTLGDVDQFHKILEPTVPLSRLIFSYPTKFYKTGIVFLSWINNHQDHMIMLEGQQSLRPLIYFSNVFKLADAAGLLLDPEKSVYRMNKLLAIYGVEQ